MNTVSCSAKQTDVNLLDEFGCTTKMDILRHLTALVLVVFVFEFKEMVQNSSFKNVHFSNSIGSHGVPILYDIFFYGKRSLATFPCN